MTIRCPWVGSDPLYIAYHDEQWGVPVHDDRQLFAKLILDGAQAGLSWLTILKKQANYWQAFDEFDAHKIAVYDEAKIAELMANPGIIRNRLKIQAAIRNAQGYLKIQAEFGSFDRYIWQFVNGQTIEHHWRTLADFPAKTAESEAMSKDLRKRGFNFVGPTICYAYMQAVGMVNDHTVDCFRHEEVKRL